jgi:iron complex transport system substrate-binding protein
MRPGSTPTSPSRKLGPAARRFAPPALFLAAVLLSSLVAQAAAPAGSAVPVPEAASSAATAHPPRLVSLNPSLTAIVARLGAGLEQESHGAALRRLGLEVEIFENERYEQVLANIERIGRLVGREAKAEERITAIRALRAAVERAVAGRPRPRTVIVLDRSPLYLVGGETFLDELLRAVGATNLGAEVARGYPRGSLEWLVAAGPELVLDLSPQAEAAAESAGALAFWSRWPSLPAVKAGRVLALDATRVSLPGPDLDRALRDLAVAVHGAPIESAIAGELAAGRGAP